MKTGLHNVGPGDSFRLLRVICDGSLRGLKWSEREEGREKRKRRGLRKKKESEARRRRENFIFRAFPGLVGKWGPRKWTPRTEISLLRAAQHRRGYAVEVTLRH